MWCTDHGSVLVCTVLSVLGLCLTPSQCHVKRGGRVYHIILSCRPVCSAQQTCVTYRSPSGAPATTCLRINPHEYHLEGTQLIFKNNVAPRAQSRRQQPLNPIESTRDQHRFGVVLPPPVRTRTFQPSKVVGAPMPIVGEQMPTFVRPNNDRISKALTKTMNKVFRKTGKVDVMLPKNNVVDTVDKGVIPTPSPVPGNTPPVDQREHGQCLSCADTAVCPDKQYCYHSLTCKIMVCQPL